MKPAWDQLSALYEDHPTVVVGDVDCTKHKPVCSSNGVRGYPTIKYFKDGKANDYRSGRDFNALKTFAESTLAPVGTSSGSGHEEL